MKVAGSRGRGVCVPGCSVEVPSGVRSSNDPSAGSRFVPRVRSIRTSGCTAASVSSGLSAWRSHCFSMCRSVRVVQRCSCPTSSWIVGRSVLSYRNRRAAHSGDSRSIGPTSPGGSPTTSSYRETSALRASFWAEAVTVRSVARWLRNARTSDARDVAMRDAGYLELSELTKRT